MKLPASLSFCILFVVLFSSSICLVNGVLVAKSTADDWATGLVRFQRTVGTATTFRVIYLTSSNSLQISPIVTNQVCIDTSVGCPSPTTLGNSEADYITAAGESAVYYREKTTGVLKRTPFTAASSITMPNSALSTSTNSQFFYSTVPTVLYRNADGSLYYASGAGAVLDTVSVVAGADAYPLPPNVRPPFSSAGVDIYWKEGTTLYYERVSGISKSVNITHASSVTAIGNVRFFSPATTKYYLVQVTAGGLNYLWVAVPNDPDNPILISGNQYTVKADDYLITAGSALVVFIARTDNVDTNFYLWKFPLASAASASPTQISTSNSGFTGLQAFSTGDKVVVRSGSSLFVIDTNTDSTVTMAGAVVSATSVYAPFATDRVVVLVDGSAAGGSALNIYNAGTGALIANIANNVNSFIAGSNGINIVYLIANNNGSPGLYRALYSSPGTSSVQLTPTGLSVSSAQSISYAITHDVNRVLYRQDTDLYLVLINGCTYVAITTQPSAPSAQNSCPGAQVTLTVAATGSNLVYQWQVNTGSWVNVAGGTSSSLMVTVGTSATSYRVLVGGDCGGLPSSTVVVTPTGNGTITTQPSFSSPVCASATQVSLSVTAGIPSSTTATYTWRKTGSSTPLSTTAGYSFARSAGNSGTYTCTIQFACNSLATNPVSIVINPTTQITAQTGDSLVCENKGNYTFSVTTVGVGLSYQWSKNGTAIPGATGSSLTVGNPLTPLVNQPTVYKVDITGTCSGASSTPSVLQVLPGSTPSITFQPLTKQVCLGAKLLFHVEATGVALSYEWYFGTTKLSETSDSLLIPSANSSHAGDYYCIVRTSNCTLTPSQLASLTVITTCKNTTNTVVFYIGSQSVQSFNDSYRETVFLPGIVAILAELGIPITADQIVITSLKDGSVYVEFGITGPNGSLAIQALLDIWNLETTDILPRNGLTTVRNIFAGSATVITPPNNNNNGGGGDGGSDNTGAIVGGVIGGIFGCALLVICLIMVVLLIVFIVRKGGLPLSKGVAGKKWQQSNWWEEDDM